MNTRARQRRGFSLIETMVAIVVMSLGIIAVLGLFGFATSQNSSQGDYGTRTTEYAQDKMEQLMGLQFTDTTSNTTVTPTASTGGTGLSAGGSVTASTPVSGYVDYINSSGVQTSTAPTGYYYMREWKISTNSDGTLTILVFVQVEGGAIPFGANPSTSLGTIKANI